MATPNLPVINSFDVTQGITITYEANNGYSPISKSVVYVLDANGAEIGHHEYVGSSTAEMAIKHVLSPVTQSSQVGWTWATGKTWQDFINNKQYQMYIVWYNTSSVASGQSNKIGFWTLPYPTVSFTLPANPDVTTYTITATYDTRNAIINNAPNETQFFITKYKQSGGVYVVDEYLTSPILYTSGVAGETGTYQISYTFNFENKVKYDVSVKTISIQGMTAEYGPVSTQPQASLGELKVLDIANDACNGCVQISTHINNITGEITGESPLPAVTSTGLDLTDHSLTFNSGLSFTPNWNFSFWGNDFNYASNINSTSDEYILHLSNIDTLENGIIDIFMVEEDDDEQKAVMCVYPTGYNGVSNYFESNVIAQPNASNNEYTCVEVQYKDYVYYLHITNVTVQPRTNE